MGAVAEPEPRLKAQADVRVSGRLARALVLATIALVPIALTFPFFSEPLDVDEGAYATVAQGLLGGQIPYRDLFDHKPPLVYAWYALSFLAFGESIEAPRLMAALVLSGVAMLVTATGASLYGRRVGYASGALFALSCGFSMLRMNANTEVFMLLPLTASLYAAVRGLAGGNQRWWLIAGVLATLAVATKPIAAPHLLVLAGAAGWSGSRPGRLSLAPVLLLTVGAIMAAATVAAPFLLAGAWSEFWWANVSYNATYNGGVETATKLEAFVQIGLLGFPTIAAPVVGLGTIGAVALVRRRRSPGDPLLLAWTAAAAVGVAATGRFYLTTSRNSCPRSPWSRAPACPKPSRRAVLREVRDWSCSLVSRRSLPRR
ncbi:MAG: hypothetical protein GEU80_05680 [Dehalococcoidia bacterium]|nr:hypothetical protein [Dehalococcoidia bacterium]